MSESKWNPETQSGTYSRPVHHGEMIVKKKKQIDRETFNRLIKCTKHLDSVWFASIVLEGKDYFEDGDSESGAIEKVWNLLTINGYTK